MISGKNVTLAALAALILTTSSAMADVIVSATERENQLLVNVDLTTNTVTPFFATPSAPDSLVQDLQGRFIYSLPGAGEVRRVDSNGLNDTLLASGLSFPQDMVLEPAGTSILVSNFANSTITRTNLAGPFPNSTVFTHISLPEGLIFDNTGRLFVLAGFGTAAAGIYQLNPITGAILNSNIGFDPANQPDGLTFDPSTGRLFATSSGIGGSNSIFSIDPNTLAAVKIATVPSPDGIINDNHGTLYVASRTGFVYSVSELTFAVTQRTAVPTIDDLGIVAAQPPTGTKTFAPNMVPPGGTSVVTITISNAAGNATLTGVGFNDALPPGLLASAPATNCPSGTASTANAGQNLVLSGATLNGGASCTVTATITDSNVAGTSSQNCVTVTSQNGGSDPGPITVAGGRCATLTTTFPAGNLTTTKAFGAATLQAGSTTTMTITIINPAGNPAASAIALTDTFPPGAPGLVVANAPFVTSTCGGTVTATPGANNISISGGTLPAGLSSCTVTVSVTGTAAGLQTNTTTAGTATVNATTVVVGPSTATITVVPAPLPPAIAKSFENPAVPVFGTTALTFLITNPNATTLTGINFTDPLAPVGLVVATPLNIVGTCNGTLPTAVAGGTTISLSGATLPGGGSCTFSVDVTSVLAGTRLNTTSTVNAAGGLVGNFAQAPLVINPPPDAYQIDYLPNVRVNGTVNVSNAGSLGADPFGPLSGTTGRICANFYVFAPDEQEIACCSCLVTPNALVHVTAGDLVGNTASGVQPDSVVVKVLFTVPGPDVNTPAIPGTQLGPFTGSNCNAATPFDVTNLAPGGRAWAVKFHATTAPPTGFSITETEFTQNPINLAELTRLTVGELNKLTTLCRFIAGNQSGAGLCKTCTLGGLGAGRQ